MVHSLYSIHVTSSASITNYNAVNDMKKSKYAASIKLHIVYKVLLVLLIVHYYAVYCRSLNLKLKCFAYYIAKYT